MILQYEIDNVCGGKARVDLNKCKVIGWAGDTIVIDNVCIVFRDNAQAEKAYEGIVAEIDRINEKDKMKDIETTLERMTYPMEYVEEEREKRKEYASKYAQGGGPN